MPPKKINCALAAQTAITCIHGLFLFRKKYRLNEVSMWDLFLMYWYETKTGEPASATWILTQHYKKPRLFRQFYNRQAILASKNLIIKGTERYQLTELAIQELSALSDLFLAQKLNLEVPIKRRNRKKPV